MHEFVKWWWDLYFKEHRLRTLILGCAMKRCLHTCKQLAVIMKDVEESLDDVRDDFEGMRMKTEVAVEATTLGIKPSQA